MKKRYRVYKKGLSFYCYFLKEKVWWGWSLVKTESRNQTEVFSSIEDAVKYAEAVNAKLVKEFTVDV